MKNRDISRLLFLILIVAISSNGFAKKKISGQISLSGAFALYPMAVVWAEEFKKENPDVKIDISAGGAGKGITDVLNNMVDIAMVSREISDSEAAKGAYKIGVARDAVVATISSQNPFLSDILATGLSNSGAKALWIDGTAKTFKDAFKINKSAPLHLYTRSDACGAAEVWAKYLGSNKKQEDLLGNGVFGDPGLALAIKSDKIGIGFNNIAYVYDLKTKKPISGVTVLPLDINENGKIDKEENFYGDLDQLTDAIEKNKYPSPPSRELYFVTKGAPADGGVAAEFIKWVLTDGQKFVKRNGYVNVEKESLKKTIDSLTIKGETTKKHKKTKQ